MVTYSHTQFGPLHWCIHGTAVLELVLAYVLREHHVAAYCVAGLAGFLFTAGLSFRSLTVENEGDCLLVRFGPLPLFRKRFKYASIRSVERARTRLMDGWGIHFFPGRGWSYNLWGFDCAEFKFDSRAYRIGSNDADRLVEFLRSKCPSESVEVL